MSPKNWLRIEDISYFFIPLGLIGGLFSKSWSTAIISPLLWLWIHKRIKSRNRKNGIFG